MSSKIARYKDYCTGCGLCHSVQHVEFSDKENGFSVPNLKEDDIAFCDRMCPAGGRKSKEFDGANIWGKTISSYLGWSYDSEVRYSASSGGVLTSLCIYLLDKRIVDGIIQITASSPAYMTKTVISRTPEDVKRCLGSRYSISSPLYEIKELLIPGETYAFVGKPCDVSALSSYLEFEPVCREQIKYLFSFFCAGTPSINAQKRLLARLECTENECSMLQYRGNGWPGFATAVKKDGLSAQITYNESWGSILGRDVRKICRFCLDGIGECADISCGDAWYPTDDGTPDFSESEGRNIIFSRTGLGEKIISQAIHDEIIYAEDANDYLKSFGTIQAYQKNRRTTMKAMILGMRIFGKTTPNYDRTVLRDYARNATLKEKTKRFGGIVKRAIKGRI